MTSIFWHRRDLRVADNVGLSQALASGAVVGAFVFDRAILNGLPKSDRRVAFIWESLRELAQAYSDRGGRLFVLDGDPAERIPALAEQIGANAVFANRDYEPAAIERDLAVEEGLRSQGRSLFLFKDHIVFEEPEIRSGAGKGYSVFSPYKGAWIKAFAQSAPQIAPSSELFSADRMLPLPPQEFPSLASLGFSGTSPIPGGESAANARWSAFSPKIAGYAAARDILSEHGTSGLSCDLRFGALSARTLAHWAFSQSGAGPQTWLSEIIWREFYSSILQRSPGLARGDFFLPQFSRIAWRNDPAHIEAWKSGQTGYPLVDAGMRELSSTGFMHNRARMVVASFFSKHLLCDWRIGEAHFARLLMDFDFASNNGGWQWAASTGADPQPYFRIFNPTAQSERFDPNGDYIRRWVPELAKCPAKKIHAPWLLSSEEQSSLGIQIGSDYPAPIVEHSQARLAALAAYKAAAS